MKDEFFENPDAGKKQPTKPINPMAKAAERCRQLLTETQVSAGGLGSILSDLQTLIEFIGTRAITTGSNRGNLPTAVLPELNALLSQPIQLELKRPLLKDYPNIAGLYVLLRVMDLVRANEKRVWINDEALARWVRLHPIEQYFTLLEAWLVDADEEVLGGERRRGFEQFSSNLRFLADTLSTRWKTFNDGIHTCGFLGGVTALNAQLQIRFGLIEVQPLALAQRRSSTRGWIMGKARRTPWGEAVAWAILELLCLDEDFCSYYYQLPEDADFGVLQPAFQPYFPEWQKVWAEPEVAARPGVYVFNASLDPRRRRGEAWHRLAVPHDASLDELAMAILAAFKFTDTDHLYEFRYRDQLGKSRTYNHPYCDDGPYGHEIGVGETALPEKGTMKFLFDFGDRWDFILRLDRIDPPIRRMNRIQLIDSGGQSPEQYPESNEP